MDEIVEEPDGVCVCVCVFVMASERLDLCRL